MASFIGTGDAIGPADLAAARICRANPSIGREAAQELAAELRDLIACVQERCAAQPKPYPEFQERDLIQTMARAAVDDRRPRNTACDGWVESVLTKAGGPDLWPRYRRLLDRIIGADMAEPPAKKPKRTRAAKKPELRLVRDIPPLDAIVQAVVTAVRQAQKGEGPNKILELVSAFRHATGLNFIMNATEAHREALFDLAQKAGIPVKS